MYSPTVTASVVRQAQVADLGWSQFVAVQLSNGYTLSDCTFEVDGVDVTSAVTPVTDDGSVVKWEITSLDPAELKVTAKDGNSRTVRLSDNEHPAKPVVKNNTSAGYMIAYGPMAIWDYYLTVYDDNGNLRVEPSKTTFDINGTSVNRSVPAAYSPVAEIVWKQNQSGKYNAEDTPMSKAGNCYLRYYIIEATGSVIRHCPEFKAFYDCKYDESTTHHHKRALALTSRKFIRMLFGLLDKSQLYSPDKSR